MIATWIPEEIAQEFIEKRAKHGTSQRVRDLILADLDGRIAPLEDMVSTGGREYERRDRLESDSGRTRSETNERDQERATERRNGEVVGHPNSKCKVWKYGDKVIRIRHRNDTWEVER